MNHCVPDWTMGDDLRSFHELFRTPNEKKPTLPDNELVELLWRNGHIVMQSQNSRKHQENESELKQSQKPDSKPEVSLINSSNLIQEDEWLQYAMDDSLEKEFGSDLLSDIPMTSTINSNKANKDDGNSLTMPPPKSAQMASSLLNSGPVNFSHFSRPVKKDMGLSNSTVGSSACGSNQVQNQNDVSYTMKEGSAINLPKERMRANTFDTTLTSSSVGSGSSYGKTNEPQSTSSLNHKRKGRDGEESECHSEEAEYESREANRTTQQKASTRKSRAAEVHNLSERRRRDRINEKMRALQELIPHCNKSDKASMLDEAIEYLKSLQLQLQLMWMGSGIAPMMFPNVQQYMSRASMPLINNQIQLAKNPLINHSSNQMPICSSPNINPVNFSAQMQNAHMPESYARYFGYPHMQMPSQAMNLYTYGSNMVQGNQTPAVAGSNSLPTAVIPSENQNGHFG